MSDLYTTNLKKLLLQCPRGRQLSEYQLNLLMTKGFDTAQKFLKADLGILQNLLAIKQIKAVFELKKELVELLGTAKRWTFKTLRDEDLLHTDYGTGIAELDQLLLSIEQPFRRGRIWELFGRAGTGKTQLMYTLALNFVCKQGVDAAQVLFVDCKNDFSAQRLQAMLRERQLDEQHLESIKVVKASTGQDLIKLLKELHQQMVDEVATALSFKLLIIDSLAACLVYQRSSEERLLRISLLSQLASLLRRLAWHGVACVLGNVSFSGYQKSDKKDDMFDEAMLGRYWSSVCTLRLCLEQTQPRHNSASLNLGSDQGLRLLKVITNTFGPTGDNCLLRITESGVV